MTDEGRQRDRYGDHAARQCDDDELDAYIEQIVARAPPLSAEQRDKLALLLRGLPRTR